MDPELLALMNQLQSAQQPQEESSSSSSSAVTRVPINDRMLGEIIMSAQQLKNRRDSKPPLNLLYLSDGCGFVTVQQLVKEITAEVESGSNNGRCAIVDLPNLLGVDITHVESAVAKALASPEGVAAGLQRTADGAELITDKYLRRVVASARQQLRRGSCKVAEVAREFRLPSAFVDDLFQRRIVVMSEQEEGGGGEAGAIDDVRFDNSRSVLYTHTCVTSQVRALTAILLARSRSVPLNEVYERHSGLLMEALREEVVARAVKLAAHHDAPSSSSVAAAQERTAIPLPGRFDFSNRSSTGGVFHPSSFEKKRSDVFHERYTTQGWILFADLEGVPNPAVFLTSKYNPKDSVADSQVAAVAGRGGGRGGSRGGRGAKRAAAAAATPTTTASSGLSADVKHSGRALSHAFVSESLLSSAAQKLDLEISNSGGGDEQQQQHQQQQMWSIADSGFFPQGIFQPCLHRPKSLQKDLSLLAAGMVEHCPSLLEQCLLVDSSEHEHDADAETTTPRVIFLLKSFFPSSAAPHLQRIARDAAAKFPRPSLTEAQLATALSRAGPSATASSIKINAEKEYLHRVIESKCAAEIKKALCTSLHPDLDAGLGDLLFSVYKQEITDIFTRACLPHRCSGAASAGAGVEEEAGVGDDPRRFIQSKTERLYVQCQLVANKFCASSSSSPELNRFQIRTAGAALLRCIVLDALLGAGTVQSLPPPEMTLEQIISDLCVSGSQEQKALSKLAALRSCSHSPDFPVDDLSAFLDQVQKMIASGQVSNVSTSLRQLGKKQERDAFRAEAESLKTHPPRVPDGGGGGGVASQKAALCLAMNVASWAISALRYHVAGDTSCLWLAVFEPAALPPRDVIVSTLRGVCEPVLKEVAPEQLVALLKRIADAGDAEDESEQRALLTASADCVSAVKAILA